MIKGCAMEERILPTLICGESTSPRPVRAKHIRKLHLAVLPRFTRYPYLALIMLCGTVVSSTAFSQGMTCGDAISQLQNYVNQVNGFANQEYYQNIPARCGMNMSCGQWWVGQLNNWYMQQTALVNGWYQYIGQHCAKASTQHTPSLRSRNQTSSAPGQIDESSVEDIDVDDEDKTVAIHIPSTPKGYR
jgi:hypothetical protein